MQLNGRYIPRSTLVLGAILLLAILGAGLYFGLGKSSSNNSANSANNAPTATLETAATQAPTIATGKGAAGKVTGPKLTVEVAATPEIQAGTWAVDIAVQGGKKRSQILGSQRLELGKAFVVSNSGGGAYTITPSILNCAKGCAATDKGYTLSPLTVLANKNATIIVNVKCAKSTLSIGIDCSRSQILASYK